MRVLVTRGQPEADLLARKLTALGHEALLEPLLETKVLAGDPARLVGNLAGTQALLFTSANGVRAFAALNGTRSLPVFAVGDSTAAAARTAGFAAIESADGNVEDLAALVARRLDPAAGSLFHGAARQLAGDLQGALEAAGFTLRRAVLYEAVAATALSESTAVALSGGQVDAIMFFSPRTAQTFVRLAQARALDSSLGQCSALCLSAAVAEKIEALSWAGVLVAERPTQDALLAGLSRIARQGDGGGHEKGTDGRPMDGNNGTGKPGSNGANGSAQAPALAIIAAFGGIRPMASKLGIAVSTVQGWRERAAIPGARHDEVRRAAKENGVTLDEDLLAASAHPPKTETPSRPAAGAAASQSPTQESATQESTTQESAAPASAATASAASRGQAASGAAMVASRPAAASQTRQSATPQSGGSTASQARESVSAARAAAQSSAPSSEAEIPAPALASNRMTVIVGAGVAAIVVILIGSFLFRPGDSEELETRIAAMAERLAAQEAQIESLTADRAATAALEERIAALEARPSGEEANAAVLADLQDRLSVLEEQPDPDAGARASAALQALSSRVDALQADAEIAAGGATALDNRLMELDRRLSAQEETQGTQQSDLVALGEAFAASGVGDSVSDASLALALGQLRDALRSSEPYETELALVSNLVADDDALGQKLDELSTHAGSGVPSLAQLKADYPAVAREAAAAGLGEEAEGLLSGVLRRVSEVVTIRPVGEVEGVSVGAYLARAEARLEADDLAGAVAELDALAPPAETPLADWLTEARARVAADGAIAELGARAVAKLGGADG